MKALAPRGAGAPAPAAPSKDFNVPQLIADLRKHKSFKQLATYSLQCLDKIVRPPRLGWELSASEALEHGGAGEVAECLARHGTDAGVFAACVSTLGALAALPRGLRVLCGEGALAGLVAGVRAFGEALDYGGSGSEGAGLLFRGL